jgi:hypothetical protein
MCFWPIIFIFTKTSHLRKFILLQMSPYWMCLNLLSSWFKQPHPLLTRHDLTYVTISSSAQSPDCLATVLVHQQQQFNWGCPSACQYMWCPGRSCFSVSIFHAQGNDKRDTLDLSDQIREVAWSLEGTTKTVANIWHAFQIVNLINVSTCH